MKKYRSMLNANGFLRSVSILISGTAISQLSIVLSTVILTRLYSPDDFGVYSVYISLLYSISVVASLLYEMAIPLPKKDEGAMNLLALGLMIVVVMSLFVHLLLHIFHMYITQWSNAASINEYLWLLPISLVGFGGFQVLTAWSLRNEDYGNMTKGKIMMNSGQVLSQLTFGLFHLGPIGLIAGEVLGRYSGSSLLTILSWKQLKSRIRDVSWKKIRTVANRYKYFPLIASWSAILNSVSFHLPTFFVAATFGPKEAGWFFLAQRVLAIPEALVGYSVKQVYLAKTAKLIHHSQEQFQILFWSTIRKMTSLGFGIIGAIVLIAPWAFEIIFGKEWLHSAVYLQLLGCLYFMQISIGPILANFYVLECQGLQFVSECIRFIFLIIVIIFFTLYPESPFISILGISIAGSIGYLLLAIFAWYAMKLRLSAGKTKSSNDTHGGEGVRRT